MRLSDFDYNLPAELIAQAPLAERVASRLLRLDAGLDRITDNHFTDFEQWLDPGDLLVFNDTRVIPARLYGQKQSGGKVEVLVERIIDDSTLLAHVRASKAPLEGSRLLLENRIDCEMMARQGDLFVLKQEDRPWLQWLEQVGHIPLPPYIRRDDQAVDRERYQTVFAKHPGAVAAPTAGLHFDSALIERLEYKGVNTARITLHVGAGTFQPVRGDNIDEHVMHAERVDVSSEVCEAVKRAHGQSRRVIAVGTTVVRSLETAAVSGKLLPLQGESELFIKPGFRFNVIDAMLTNFHLPRSTLLMLVSAFAGTDLIQRAYCHAVHEQYRFFSYGDAMFIENGSAGRQ